MIASPRLLTWALRFYPPLFFQRIWVIQFYSGFTGVEVIIRKSILNINYNKSIFGGTIFGAADPFFAICFYQILKQKGYKTVVWTKSAQIHFIKPTTSSLFFSIKIDKQEIDKVIKELNNNEKFIKFYPIEIINKQGEICASLTVEIYIRKIN